MKLSTEYNKNIKNKIVTIDMFIDALYSVNKRAKNCRDKIRDLNIDYYNYYKYDSIKTYTDKKEKYYLIKSELLSFVTPTCIHKEFKYYDRIRIYDYDKCFASIKDKDIVWSNSYYDYDKDIEVDFVDIENKNKPIYFYYLFYDFGKHSFHTPINEIDLNKYKDLPIKEIDKLVTDGLDITELVSVQFVNKVLILLKQGIPIKYE